jgi:hypothetical protein
MKDLSRTPNNQRKLAELRTEFARALDEALREGFFGTVAVEVTIQDGSVQYTVCRAERKLA